MPESNQRIHDQLIQPSLQENTSSLQPSPRSWFTRRKIPLFSVIVMMVLLGIVLVVYLLSQRSFDNQPRTENPIPVSSLPIESSTSTIFGTQTVNLVAIQDASPSGFGYANRNITSYNILHHVLAVLPKPPQGTFYEAWLIRNPNENFSLGRLYRSEEGQYLLTSDWVYFPNELPFSSFEDFPKIVVSLETSEDDVIERRLLVGQFSEPESN